MGEGEGGYRRVGEGAQRVKESEEKKTQEIEKKKLFFQGAHLRNMPRKNQ